MMRPHLMHVFGCCALLVGLSACTSQELSDDSTADVPTATRSGETVLVHPDVDLHPNNTAPEIGDWLSEEIQSFNHPFPSEQYVPRTILDLFPEIENGVLVEQEGELGSDAETVMVELPSSPDMDSPTYVSISRGDAYSSMSDRWYCAWVDEYLLANKASDPARTAQALESLEAFQADGTAQTLSINLETYREDIYNPLAKGDTEPASAFVEACQSMK